MTTLPESKKQPQKASPLLTIIVLSLVERINKYLTPLLQKLDRQEKAFPNQVELMVLTDNKWRTIGAKRNLGLQLAQGRYVVQIDDDDMVSDNFVESILRVLRKHSDAQCVVYKVWVTGYHLLGLQPEHGSVCKYSVEYDHVNLADGTFLRKPNPRMVYLRDIAKNISFPDKNAGEDDEWGAVASRYVDPLRQYSIDDILYFYNYNHHDSRAEGHSETVAQLVSIGKLTPRAALSLS